jgi:hypothetical protein
MDPLAKNKLQEYYQKQKKALPTYKSNRVGGTDHKPIWQSIVTLENGDTFTSFQSSCRKEAEISAATNALCVIQNADYIFIEIDTFKQYEAAISIKNRYESIRYIFVVDEEFMDTYPCTSMLSKFGAVYTNENTSITIIVLAIELSVKESNANIFIVSDSSLIIHDFCNVIHNHNPQSKIKIAVNEEELVKEL